MPLAAGVKRILLRNYGHPPGPEASAVVLQQMRVLGEAWVS